MDEGVKELIEFGIMAILFLGVIFIVLKWGSK